MSCRARFSAPAARAQREVCADMPRAEALNLAMAINPGDNVQFRTSPIAPPIRGLLVLQEGPRSLIQVDPGLSNSSIIVVDGLPISVTWIRTSVVTPGPPAGVAALESLVLLEAILNVLTTMESEQLSESPHEFESSSSLP
eukprot:4619061-Heterocapsa_arctica.AAC.1